jgi:hypothetical protein
MPSDDPGDTGKRAMERLNENLRYSLFVVAIASVLVTSSSAGYAENQQDCKDKLRVGAFATGLVLGTCHDSSTPCVVVSESMWNKLPYDVKFETSLTRFRSSSSLTSSDAMPRPVQRHIRMMHFSCFGAQRLSEAGSRSLRASRPPLTPAGWSKSSPRREPRATAISAMPSRLFTGRERMALSCSPCVATRMGSGWCVVRR